MGEYSGSALYVAFISTSGTVSVGGDYRTFRTSETADEIDATAGADQRKVYLAGPMDGEASVEYVDQSKGTVNWAGLLPGKSGTVEWGPEGTASGYPKNTQAAVILSRERTIAYNDVAVVSVGFRLSGTQTNAVYP